MEIDHPAPLPSIDSISEARICRRCLTFLSARNPTGVCERCARFEFEARDHKRRRLDTRDARTFQNCAPLFGNAFGKEMGTDRRASAQYMPTTVGRSQYAPNGNGMRRASYPHTSVKDGKHSTRIMTQSHIVPSQPPLPRPPTLVPQAGHTVVPASTFAPHFNSRGELIHPSPPPAPARLPPAHAMGPRQSIRFCARHNCSVILSQKEASGVCLRCRNVLLQPSHQLHQIPRHVLSCITMPTLPLETSEIPRHALSRITMPTLPLETSEIPVDTRGPHGDYASVASSTPVVVDDVLEDDLDDLQLLYPEPGKEPTSSASQPPPSPTPRPPLPAPHGIRLRIPAASHQHPKLVNPVELTIEPSDSQTQVHIPPTRKPISLENVHSQRSSRSTKSASTDVKKLPPPRLSEGRHTCSSPGCDSFLQADSMTLRCFRCVMKDWKSRLRGEGSPSDKKRKTVTWADKRGIDSETDEGIVDDAADSDDASPRPEESRTLKIKIRIPPARRSSVSTSDSGLGDSPQPSGGVDVTTQCSVKSEHEPEAVAPSVDLQPSAGPSSASSSSGDPLVTIRGWDSDLTDLSDLSDNVQSEIDGSSSDEEPLIQHRMSGFKIRIPARPKPPPPSAAVHGEGAICTIKRCQRALPQGYRWKCCVTCRLHHREYQRKRQGIQGRHTHLDHEVGGYHDHDFTSCSGPVSKPEPEELLLMPGARLCSIKNCTHVIPAREEYKWKMCEPCRIRTRNNQKRIRRMNLGVDGDVSGGDHPRVEGDTVAGGSESESEDIPLSVVTAERRACEGSSTGLRRCQSQDCGMWVDPSSSEALCTQCLTRRAEKHSHGKRGRPRKDAGISEQTRKPAVDSFYPEYKCWSALLDEFHTRLVGFLEAQSFYFLYKQSPRTAKPDQARVTSNFGFDGEFSVVALDFDISGRKDAVHRHSVKLAREMARVGSLEFDPTCWVSTPDRSIVTRFACAHHPPKTYEPAGPSALSASRQMRGELEIAVLPDHTHMLFPGQRTIVRFRLAG